MGDLIKSWDAAEGRGCVLYVDSLAVGQSMGPFSDSWGTCSHEDFLKGMYQGEVLTYFGQEVLDEVISLIKNKGENPVVIEKRTTDYQEARIWEKIPLNPELENIYKNYDERGHDHYFKKEGYMIYFPEHGFQISGDEESSLYEVAEFIDKKIEFIPFGCSAAIYCNGLFHLAGGEMAIFDKDGNYLLDSFSSKVDIKLDEEIKLPFPHMKNLELGDRFRIEDIYRRGNDVVYFYDSFYGASDSLNSVVGQKGLLKITPEGIVCRWVLEK